MNKQSSALQLKTCGFNKHQRGATVTEWRKTPAGSHIYSYLISSSSCAMPINVGGHGSLSNTINRVMDQMFVPVSFMPRRQTIQVFTSWFYFCLFSLKFTSCDQVFQFVPPHDMAKEF
ncbi:hypothetical protein BsWGS_10867 [Bradybaena similaris]